MAKTSRKKKSRKKRKRRTTARARDRRRHALAVIGAMLATGGLGACVTALLIVGPPPALRIDALWVHGHLLEVRLAAIGLTVACAGTAMVIAARTNRRMVAGLWAATGVMLIALAPRVRVIATVVFDYFRETIGL